MSADIGATSSISFTVLEYSSISRRTVGPILGSTLRRLALNSGRTRALNMSRSSRACVPFLVVVLLRFVTEDADLPHNLSELRTQVNCPKPLSSQLTSLSSPRPSRTMNGPLN